MKAKFLKILIIILACFLVFTNSLKNQFAYDDIDIIKGNILIRSPQNIPKILVSNYWEGTGKGQGQNLWRPLVMISYVVDYSIWRLNTIGFHLTNILFHTMNSILVFFLFLLVLKNIVLKNILKSETIAFFAALIFAVHPIHTEVVTGIVGRSELMVVFFYLAALVAYINSGRKSSYYFLSLLSFILALLSKETALTLPVMIVLYDIFSASKIKKDISKKFKYYYGYAGVTFVYVIAKISIFGSITPVETTTAFYTKGIISRMLTMSEVFMDYIRLLFYPVQLSIVYNINSVITDSLSLKNLSYIILLFLIIIIAVRIYRHSKAIAFSLFWCFTAMLPVSNIIPIGDLIAERFLYLPSAGFCLIIGVLACYVKKKEHQLAVMAGILLCFSFLTVKRNSEWKDNITLWSSAVKRFPDNAKAYNYLGMGYHEKNMLDKAIEAYKESIRLNPGDSYARNNLGVAYINGGFLDDAISAFMESMKLNPAQFNIYSNIGGAYFMKKSYDEAIRYFNESLRLNPFFMDAYSNMAITYFMKGMYYEAKRTYEKALELCPDSVDIRNKLRILEEQHRNIQ